MKLKDFSWSRMTLLLTGVLVTTLSLLALSVWHIRALTGSVGISILEMHDGAAIGFVLCGFALLSAALQKGRFTTPLGAIILMIGALGMFDYFIHLPLQNDLVLSLLTAGHTRSGPVSMQISLPLFIIGLAFLRIRATLRRGETSFFLGVIGSIVVAIGLISFFGIQNNILVRSAWTHFSYQTVSTAAGFILIGAGIIACAWYRAKLKTVWVIEWLPLTVTLVIIIITLLVWQALLLQKNYNIRRFTQLQATDIQHEIINHVLARVHSLQRMAGRWQEQDGLSKSSWMFDAQAHLMHYRDFLALAWINPQNKPQWTALRRVDEKQFLLTNFEKNKPLLETQNRVQDKNQPQVSPGVELENIPLNFSIFIPLHNKKHFAGFLVALDSYTRFFDDVLTEDIAPGYNILVHHQGKEVYHRGDLNSRIRIKWGQIAHAHCFGTNWQVEIWPTDELLDLEKTAVPTVTLVMGVIAALLLGFTIRLAQIAQIGARRITQVNHDLLVQMLERERAEDAKRHMEKVLLQNQKLQAIGTLAGGIAHDFNNILYSIIGYVQMSKEDVADERVKRNLDKVLAVSERGQELIAQILSFSRRRPGTLQPLSLQKVLKNTLSVLHPNLLENIHLTEHYDKDHDRILGNFTQLQQVFANVINNAIDAMKGKGELQIRTFYQQNSEELVKKHPNLDAYAYIVTLICDTGSGMDKMTKDRIFEPFFTTKEVNKGTGLGLAISHGIIQEHQGDIIVESEISVGTAFYVYLPEYTEK